MKDKIKNASRRTLALFAAALLALGAGSIMSARAVLNIVSDTFDTNLKMANVMEVTILEGKDNESNGFKLGSADYKEGKLAVYTCKIGEDTKYVIPVYGMGLWGPISGYIALDSDCQTVFGAYFNHDSETAGLGAEIKDSQAWQEKFIGKKLFAEGSDDIALSVEKNVDKPESQVDAVTGATLTSNGVRDMLKEGLGKYVGFFKSKQNKGGN